MRTPSRHTASDGSVTYKVRFRREGRQSSETFYDRHDADQFCRLMSVMSPEVALEHMQRERIESTHLPTLDEWSARYIDHLTGITSGTRLNYERVYARTFGPLIGELPIDVVDRESVARSVNALSDRYADKSVANAHGLLAAMMARAVDAGLITKSPCRGIRLPRRTSHQRVEPRYLTVEEFADLLSHLPKHYQPLVLTLAGTGMRWGEAEALEVGDVDLTRDTVRINKAAKWNGSKATREVGPPKTQRSRRTIALPAEVVDAIRPLVVGRDRTERLFLAPRGGPLRHRTTYDSWKKACEEAGLEPQPRLHDLRHSHTAWLIAAGVSLPVMQARLGHESIKTTVDVYGHLLPDLQRAAADAAHDVLGYAKQRALDPTPD